MTLYEPLDFAVVRAPLLPVDTLDSFSGGGKDLRDVLSSELRAALAVASLTFSDALARDSAGPLDPRTESTLRRYLIRMSTRSTPLGLFAAVGLANWGERTDIELAAGHRPRRTRPDAAWLMALVDRAESDPQIRRHLHVRANPLALTRAGRLVLAEQTSRDNSVPVSVSVRATEVVHRGQQQRLLAQPDPSAESTCSAVFSVVTASFAEAWLCRRRWIGGPPGFAGHGRRE